MKENNKISSKALKVVERLTRNEVEKNMFTWPPICMGIYHQPKRPKRRDN